MDQLLDVLEKVKLSLTKSDSFLWDRATYLYSAALIICNGRKFRTKKGRCPTPENEITMREVVDTIYDKLASIDCYLGKSIIKTDVMFARTMEREKDFSSFVRKIRIHLAKEIVLSAASKEDKIRLLKKAAKGLIKGKRGIKEDLAKILENRVDPTRESRLIIDHRDDLNLYTLKRACFRIASMYGANEVEMVITLKDEEGNVIRSPFIIKTVGEPNMDPLGLFTACG